MDSTKISVSSFSGCQKGKWKVEGKETVQVYIRDRVASLTQPIKRLVDFKQVVLKAGESQVVQFELTKEDLGFYNTSYEFVAEDGAFDIMVGPDSQNLKKETITLTF